MSVNMENVAEFLSGVGAEIGRNLVNIVGVLSEAGLTSIGIAPWVLLAVFLTLVFLSVWRIVAPGWRGVIVPYGVHDIYGYTSGLVRLKFKSYLCGLTNEFLAEWVKRKFQSEIVKEEIKSLEEVLPESEKQHLEKLKDATEKFSLESIRLIGARRALGGKHLFVCFFSSKEEAERFPYGYIAPSTRPSLNIFTLEFLSRGIFQGTCFTLPTPWNIPGHSKVTVHLFIPWKLPSNEPEISVKLPELEDVARLSAFIKSNVEWKAKEQTYRRMYTEARKREQEILREKAVYSTLADTALEVLSGFLTKGEFSRVLGRITGRWNVALGFLPVMGMLLGGFFAQYFHYDTFLGGLMGALASMFFLLIFAARRL